MKKQSIFLTALLFSGALLVSCGDNTDSTSDVQYADLTVEQNKAKLQDDALATMDKLQGMSNLEAVKVMPDVMKFSQLMGSGTMDAVLNLLKPVSELKSNTAALGKNAVAAAKTAGGEFSTLLQYRGGTYTYNAQTQAFDRVAATDHITFLFPIGTSTTNNGKLELTNVVLKTVTVADSSVELPLGFDLKLYKGTTALVSFEYDAAINANNNPTLFSTKITFSEGYTFSEKLTNNESAMGFEFAYTFGKTNILSAGMTSAGTFTQEQLMLMENSKEDNSVEKVVSNANAWVQLGDIKVTGLIDLKTIVAGRKQIVGDKEYVTDTVTAQKMIKLLNSNVKLVVLYASDNKAFAMSKFVAVQNEEEVFDYETFEYKTITIYEPELLMVFKDGSAMTENFFETGFTQLQQAYEQMLTSMQTNYGGLK